MSSAQEAAVSQFPNRSIPLYYQLEHILRTQIESGEAVPGQRLPTEQELSRQYHISRATVRQALAALVSEGLLYRRQGKGTFVTERPSRRGRRSSPASPRTCSTRGTSPRCRCWR